MKRNPLVGTPSAWQWMVLVAGSLALLPELEAAPIRVLLISGQNNHDWRQTTPVLKEILEREGTFQVDVTEHPESCTPWSFAGYEVLLSNWNAWGPNAVTNWPQATRSAFLEYVRNGGGLVVVHAGSSSFYDWPEYQQVSAGSWDLAKTGHGSVHEFEVRMADPDHPITRGLTPFRTTDELWHRTGFQPGVHVLAAAFSDKERGGSGMDEPVAVTRTYGQGRTFYLVLGHDARAMQAAGFQSLLVRGTEWAARGEVTPAEASVNRELRDVSSDTWVATDALGRSLPLHEAVGPPRTDRTVGIFYFLWHGAHIQGGPYDVSRILATDPGAMEKPDSPLWGPLHAPHHWGESIFGYYLTRDEGVLRKHAQMLADAGVDVVIFDVTNQITYREDYLALLRVWSECRALGNRTPQVAFLTPFWDPAKVVRELWEDLYSRGLLADLWFQWDGRPLILADPEKLEDEAANAVRRFFTFRKPQPDYFQGPTRLNMWSWLEVHPQHVFRNTRGENEQMSVGVAQNAVGKRLGSMSEPEAKGRSWHDGAQDRAPDAILHGLNFQEQWDHALQQDPRFIFVTGWNEWIAGRFAEFNGVRYPVMFVDQFDQEHSRDIEPMRGGHGDNYLYQLSANIRRYKGVRPIVPVRSAAIRIDGEFDDWRPVQPEFRDTIGDPVQRECRGWDPQVTYRDQTGRNDIVSAKISADAQQLFCQVSTRAPMVGRDEPGWMILLLDVDGDPGSGWFGYDFVVNLGEPGRLSASTGGSSEWRPVQMVPWRQAGHQLELSVPWGALGLDGPPAALDFKWTDHVPLTGDWEAFTLHGDAAPNDRYKYRARLEPLKRAAQ